MICDAADFDQERQYHYFDQAIGRQTLCSLIDGQQRAEDMKKNLVLTLRQPPQKLTDPDHTRHCHT